MSFGYRYTVTRRESGRWLLRFPDFPGASATAETQARARSNATECLITALMDTMRTDLSLPRRDMTQSGGDYALLPSLVIAKLTVYQCMHEKGWTRARLAAELGMQENAVRRLLDLHHNSHLWVIDQALAKMDASLQIDLPQSPPHRHAA
jgi:antitoxin HicB